MHAVYQRAHTQYTVKHSITEYRSARTGICTEFITASFLTAIWYSWITAMYFTQFSFISHKYTSIKGGTHCITLLNEQTFQNIYMCKYFYNLL